MNLLYYLISMMLIPGISKAEFKTHPKIPVPYTKPKNMIRKPQSESHMQISSVVPPSSLVINPSISIAPTPKPKGPTYFKLNKLQNKNQIELSFESYDPHLKLNPNAPFAIQFITSYPFHLNRSIIIGNDWPKTGNTILLSYADATPRIANKIRGKASYTVCHELTHKCKAVMDPILFQFIP